MRRPYKTLVLALPLGLASLILLTGCLPPPRSRKASPLPPPPSATAPAPPSNLSPEEAAGKVVFDSKCLACHTIGKGDGVGPDLAGVVQRREKDWLVKWLKDPEEMLKTDKVAMELLAKYKNVPMPNQALSETDIAQVLTYLKTAKTEATKKLELASDIGGRPIAEFVSSECGGCHNPTRIGATGPNITKKRLHEGTDKLGPLNVDSMIAVVTHGRPGTLMPAWSKTSNPIGRALSEKEINAITTYLYENEAPTTFSFTMEQMKKRHQVLQAEDPAEPTHERNIDNLMLCTEREASRIAVFDCDKQEIVTHMPGGVRVHGYTFNPKGRWAYNLARDGWLFMYDLYTLKPKAKVRVGTDARGIAVSDDGKWLLCGMYIPFQAVIVDAQTLQPVKIIDTSKVTNPSGEIVQSRICSVNDVKPEVGPYFLMALKEAGQVWRIDWSKPDFPVTKTLQVGEILHDGFLTPDNKTFFIASQLSDWVSAIDVETMAFKKTEACPDGHIRTGKKPHPGSGAIWHGKDKDGKEALFAATPHIGEGKNVIWNANTLEIVGEVPSKGPGLFVRTNPHMKYVWFDSVFFGGEEITVHEKDWPFKVVKRINEGTLTVHPEPDATGKFVYISDWKEGVVRIYDERTQEKVKTLTGLITPTGKFSVGRMAETEGH